jgi:DNA modification methylase
LCEAPFEAQGQYLLRYGDYFVDNKKFVQSGVPGIPGSAIFLYGGFVMSSNPATVKDPRNQINDLSNEEWFERASSISITPQQKEAFLKVQPNLQRIRAALMELVGPEMVEALFGDLVPGLNLYTPIRPDDLTLMHPTPFDEREVAGLIELLTKRNDVVLDIFAGTGTTLTACYKTGRVGAGIELMPEWIEVAEKKIANVTGSAYEYGKHNLFLKQGDSREILSRMNPEVVDFIITSPPYYKIMKNPKNERATKRARLGLATTFGHSDKDLGRIENYDRYMAEIKAVYKECYRVLRPGKFMAIIIADLITEGRFIAHHIDTVLKVCECGFVLRGVQVVMDHWRRGSTYGIPTGFLLSFRHHYVLIFQK